AGIVPLQLRVLLVPSLHVGNHLIDARQAALRPGEVVDQRGVQHVPGALPAQLRYAVTVQDPPTRRQAGIAAQRLNVGGGAAAHPIAVDVERLDRIVDVLPVLQILIRRRVLLPELHHRLPYGQRLLLIGHAAVNERALPRLHAGDVLDPVREHFDVADPDDRRGVGCWLLGIGTGGGGEGYRYEEQGRQPEHAEYAAPRVPRP